MIGVLDYGVGNIGSILNMLKKIGAEAKLVSSPDEMPPCDKLILPGVGSFDAGMKKLQSSNLVDGIMKHARDDKPLLGICLGMQMLGKSSEEGREPGLNLVPFSSRRFVLSGDSELKIPHMGWNVVKVMLPADKLVEGLDGAQRYYFVHSYHAVCEDKENELMTCEYEYEFAAAVKKGNVYGVQFHPEKSHRFGMALLENFVREV